MHEGAKAYFPSAVTIKTFDIDPNSGCDYIGDICQHNEIVKDDTFDYIVCTEVLEQTLKPWNAVNEIFRIFKLGGYLFVSVPFNFRIHGPLLNCPEVYRTWIEIFI